MSTPEDLNISEGPPKIRLPELPIFQKYSIALRQEFADASEFATILEKTLARIRTAPAALKRGGATSAPDSVSTTRSRSEHDDALTKTLPVAPAPSGVLDDPPADDAFWEMASPNAPRPPLKHKRKAMPPPAVVRVSSSGKPIVESKPLPGKPAPSKARPKK